MDSANHATVVAQLREEIRRLQAAPRSYLAVLRTGLESFDGLFPEGGLPLGHGVELWGEAGSGRTRTMTSERSRTTPGKPLTSIMIPASTGWSPYRGQPGATALVHCCPRNLFLTVPAFLSSVEPSGSDRFQSGRGLHVRSGGRSC